MAKNTSASKFDMQEHEKTYTGFIAMSKFSIVAMVFIMVALYCFIVAEAHVLGWLLVIVAAPAAFLITRKRPMRH